MEKDDSCAFCGGSLRLGKRNNLIVVRCLLCGWVGPTLPPVPRAQKTEAEKFVAKLRCPKAAVRIAHQMGVRL